MDDCGDERRLIDVTPSQVTRTRGGARRGCRARGMRAERYAYRGNPVFGIGFRDRGFGFRGWF